MFKKLLFISIASMLTISVANAKQVFTQDELIELNKQKPANGIGTLYGKFSFTRDMALADQAIKEIGWMTLMPGDSIGLHKHEHNEDTYIIISGEGIFTTTDGEEFVVKAGDITIARKNESHGLKNSSKEPLIFLDIIAQQ